MVETFWGRKWWRYDRWIWGGALLVIAAGQLSAGRSSPGVLLLVCMSGFCFLSAWRRSTIPLYTITDDALVMRTGLLGNKRLLWRDIKQMQQDGYGVRLIGWQWFGGAPLNLAGLPRAQRETFLQLVQDKIAAANTARDASKEDPA